MNSRLRVLAVFSFVVLAVAIFIGSLAPSTARAHTYSGNYVGPITFNSSDVLTAANLNQAINHIHNTFGNIVNSHIAAGAAIAHTKLANPILLPRAAGVFYESTTVVGATTNYTACTSATCQFQGDRVSSVTSAGSVYSVTLAYTPQNAAFGVQITPVINSGLSCRAYDFQTIAPHFKIACGAGVAAQFTVYDNDN